MRLTLIENKLSTMNCLYHGNFTTDLLKFPSSACCFGEWEPKPRDLVSSVEATHMSPGARILT